MEGINRIALGMLLAALTVVVGGCAPATAPPGAPQADLKWPPVGSGWVQAEETRGSFGSETRRANWKFLGEQTWQGKKVMAFSDGVVTNYTDSRRRLLGTVRGTALAESYQPHYTTFDWPLFVGKSWPNRFTYRDEVRGRSFENVEQDGKVEAYEDVKTPAGTLKAFRIKHEGPGLRVTSWYAPELGLFVKSHTERLQGFPAGPGVRQMELVSYELKP
jgi:hypothetical protein